MTLDDLDYPFYAAPSSSALPEDLSFAYHAYIQDDKARAICNDIPCQSCPFTCKNGTGRQEALLAFARDNFPELLI